MVNLFTTYYEDEKRQRELDLVLSLNEGSDSIDCVYLLDESGRLAQAKQISGRPTFQQIFDYVNEVTKVDDINIVANSDIFFDEEGIEIAKLLLEPNDCWALTRWDIIPERRISEQRSDIWSTTYIPEHAEFMNRRDSQDTWVFRGKVKPGNYDFQIGMPGCDNRMAYELQQAGYNISNPSLTIKTFHLHKGEERSWHGKPQVPQPYLLINPTEI